MNTFATLSPSAQQTALLELAECGLPHWGLSGELSLIKQRENAVYRLDTSDGRIFALRVHRAGYHSDAALAAEQIWIDALGAAGIGVPTILPTVSGAAFALVDHKATGTRQVDLLAWIDGVPIGTVEDGLINDSGVVTSSYRRIGQVAAQIHNQAAGWRPPADFERHAWDLEGLVGETPFWGPFWQLESLSPQQREQILRSRERIAGELAALGTSSDDFSMIHADLVPENVLVAGDHTQVIDFDDAGFGWHLFELATALYFIQDDPLYAVARDALIAGYREFRPLSDEKLASLPVFLVARSFTYLGWVHTRSGSETARELTPLLIELCVDTMNRYGYS